MIEVAGGWNKRLRRLFLSPRDAIGRLASLSCKGFIGCLHKDCIEHVDCICLVGRG
jgi:hypothetical protein